MDMEGLKLTIMIYKFLDKLFMVLYGLAVIAILATFTYLFFHSK